MKILVTGASGFIGNYVLNYLVTNTEHEIIATSRNRDKVNNSNWLPKVEFVEADLYSTSTNLFDLFKNPDILIHLAWSNLPNYTKSFHLTDNLPNEIQFLERMINDGIRKIVVTGSCFEYGIQEGELNENLPTYPNNPYAIAKDSLRRYLEFKSSQNFFHLLWLRLFYTFGEGQSKNSLIPQLEKSLKTGQLSFNMTGGEQIRDYLPIEEVAELIVKSSLNNDLHGIVNISSGNPVRLKDFIIKYLESKENRLTLNLGYYPYSSLEPMAFWGNNNKLKTKIT